MMSSQVLGESAKHLTATAFLVALSLVAPVRAQTGGIELLAITSSASFNQGIPNRGALASIFCRGLEVAGTVAAESLPLPRTLAGVRVLIGGAEAPILAVANLDNYQQVNVQVPLEAGSDPDITIEQNGRRGERRWFWGIYPWADSLGSVGSAGEFFQLLPANFGVFQHAGDYSLVTTENPARPGETLIGYLTGMSTSAVATGEPAPADPVVEIKQWQLDPGIPAIGEDYYYLKFNLDYNQRALYTFDSSTDARVSFAGLVPVLVGVNQINFTVPSAVPSGLTNITLIRKVLSNVVGYWDYVQISSPVVLPVQSGLGPLVNAVTTDQYSSHITADAWIVIWGKGFSSAGGNAVQLTRPGYGDVWLREGDGHAFWDSDQREVGWQGGAGPVDHVCPQRLLQCTLPRLSDDDQPVSAAGVRAISSGATLVT